MSYIVKMMGGDEVEITDDEFKALDGKTGLLFIPSVGEVVNLSSVSRIFPAERKDRSKQVFGILHDGSRAVRQFGRWFDMDSPKNESGNHTVSFDPAYYPEVAKDCVPTPEEWERDYLALSSLERKAKMFSSIKGTPLLIRSGDDADDEYYDALGEAAGRPSFIELTPEDEEDLLVAKGRIRKALDTGPQTESFLREAAGDCRPETVKKYLRWLEDNGYVDNIGGLWEKTASARTT